MEFVASADPASRSARAANPYDVPPGGLRYSGGTITGRHQSLWKGARATVTEVECLRNIRQEFMSDRCRLLVMLEGTGTLEMRASQRAPAFGAPQQHLSLVPGNVPVWGVGTNAMHFRHLVINLDCEGFEVKIPCALRNGASPQLMFQDGELQRISELLADACAQPSESRALYGDGLAVALHSRLCDRFEAHRPDRYRSGLAPWQLRRVFEFFESHMDRTIRVSDLAELTKLSQSYFCKAFKTSTGYSPHQWQMKVRVDRAKELLRSGNAAIADVACNVGFADQAHLTRVFHRVEGVTPGAFRRENSVRRSAVAVSARSTTLCAA